MVHTGEIHTIHLHNLVTNLEFRVRRRNNLASDEAVGFQMAFLNGYFKNCNLESDFSRKGAWLDIADVDPRLLGRTTGDADAHAPGAH